VRDGLTDVYVEHRGAGPPLRIPRGEVIGRLRTLGATEDRSAKWSDPVNACHALYTLLPWSEVYPSTTVTDSVPRVSSYTTQAVGKERSSSLSFTLTGERVSALTGERASALPGEHVQARAGKRASALTGERALALTGERVDELSHMMCPKKCQAYALSPSIRADANEVKVLRAFARGAKDRKFPWGCEGATWLDRDGYPCYHEEATTLRMLHSDNFHVVEDCAVAGAEKPAGDKYAASLNAQSNTLRVGSRVAVRALNKQLWSACQSICAACCQQA